MITRNTQSVTLTSYSKPIGHLSGTETRPDAHRTQGNLRVVAAVWRHLDFRRKLPPSFDDYPEVMKLRDACAVLRVNQTTMRRLITSGQVKAIRLGKRGEYRIAKADLLALFK